MLNFFIGLFFSSIIAIIAYKSNSLTFSGSLCAIFVGTLIYTFGGFYLSIIMISFFVSSSLITKFKKEIKNDFEKLYKKTSKRDYTQVLVNSLPAIIYSILYFYSKNNMFLVAYGVFFAAANSDTWASELGVLSSHDPINILTLKKMQRGISGGVTLTGLFFSFIGSFFIGIVFMIGYIIIFKNFLVLEIVKMFLIITFGGFIGSFLDSLLGILFQSLYIDSMGVYTEKEFSNGKKNKLVKGYAFFDNNMVNLLSTSFVSFLSVFVYNFL
ncbi:DUF92 domain-containing protein [Oceanotoga sp. DSM 15011]|uniref:DUF92 domain-containing protein n=1 Tax=Oceanotoga TaxID=1255275 RepID=UPI0021F3F1EB|nr:MULTISPECIES: DUF92 domain-containing protein [Oceanotoga]MDO7975723.1 DUF92 domain-containing protein [Oceanotoga teriensis]UYO99773.1 DUF92 domain-containing protein [Oceanotoga sp. DSM 15011]